jgi:anthranilate 1,2-dioxygenase small subunit
MELLQTNELSRVGRDVALRLEIERLYADYAQIIDDDRLEDWPGLFVENGTYRITTGENHDNRLALAIMYCDGRGMMSDRISALRQANIFEPHVYCHLTSNVRMLDLSADEIRTRSNFAVIRTMQEGDQAIFACGRSFDRIVEVGGQLLFKERLMVVDSRQIDTLLVIPI